MVQGEVRVQGGVRMQGAGCRVMVQGEVRAPLSASPSLATCYIYVYAGRKKRDIQTSLLNISFYSGQNFAYSIRTNVSRFCSYWGGKPRR